jgi:ubiquinone/menaquinone biosynthesis C-methylase UbiE
VKAAPDFDRLAKPYRWLEYLTFGPFLQRARTYFLPSFSNCRSALVLGDGDGRFAARLLQSNPRIRVHAVDVSPRMLDALLRSAGTNANRITTEVADLRTWQPQSSERYDLIATHFSLDCLTTSEVGALARGLRTVATHDAVWAISDFHVPRNRFGRWLAAPLIASLYRAFRVLAGLRVMTLPDHAQALTHCGWKLDAERLHLGGLLISQLWVPA